MTGHSGRKHHRKSRNGCSTCKSRHIKCDELRPRCSNCKISYRQCRYPLERQTPRKPQYERILDPVSWLEVPPGQPSPAISELSSENEPNLFSLSHLSLFRHVDRNMADWMMVTEAMKPLLEAYISCAMETPFMMDLLMSLAAMHLSTFEQDATQYRTLATNLQERALLGFNKSLHDVSGSSDLPKFLFSSILGLHYLAEKVAPAAQDFDTTFQNLLKYLQLQRGARVFGETLAPNSDLHKLISRIKTTEDRPHGTGPGSCPLIEDMLQVSELNEESLESCKGASRALDFLYFQLRKPRSWGVHALMSFPNFITLQFIGLLEKRTPEALVILAHYCVSLHEFRSFWCVGGAGERVHQGILARLPPFWAPYAPALQTGSRAM